MKKLLTFVIVLSMIMVIGLALSLAKVTVTHAATCTVTTIADELNNDGDCSLREAILAANTDTAVDNCPAGSGADTIILPAGSYYLSIVGTGEDGNVTGDLDITDDLTIIGASTHSTIINGNVVDRVFDVHTGATVYMSNVTITGGYLGASAYGGGINNNGTLTLNYVTVSGNRSRWGGGILNSYGGTLTIENSTVSDNSAPEGGDGGGIANVGDMTLINVTISGNFATDSGGVANWGTTTATATLINVTIADNIGDDASGITGPGNTFILKNTIVANNLDTNGYPSDCQRPVVSNGHNLDSDGSCGFTSEGDLSNTDPVLGPLKENGGPTQTHALLTGSPAIDAGSSDCPPPDTDQRGVTRPQGSHCDIGAYEVIIDNEPPVVTNVQANPNPVPVNTVIDISAVVKDNSLGDSSIELAEYSLDNGDWISMSPSDGGYDSPTEAVEATLSGFTEASVHEVCVRGTDAAGNASLGEDCTLLAVYDPNGGFVTGGGWLDSPEGAYKPDPLLTGKATFGFVSKYNKKTKLPEGNTQFVFNAGDLNFHSSDFDWLVVNKGDSRAQFKGTGTISGEGPYKFMLWAADSDPDTFRIKIWWEDGEVEDVIYDNGVYQTLGGGNIVVHTKN